MAIEVRTADLLWHGHSDNSQRVARNPRRAATRGDFPRLRRPGYKQPGPPCEMTVLTRNTVDFKQIPNRTFEDWTTDSQ